MQPISQPERHNDMVYLHLSLPELLLTKLREDGSNSGDTHPVKVGIRLAKNGKVPRVIDIEAPHPVVNTNRRVYRKVRVDMGEVFYAPVRNLKPELDTKYSVVEIK